MPNLTASIEPIGPMVTLGIGVSAPRQDAMRAANIPVPPPMVIRGLLDTGASCTCVDPTVIQNLGLLPTGTTQIHTPSTGHIPHTCNQFDVMLGILLDNSQLHIIITLPVIESALIHQGFHALIGRDVLSQAVFIYNGPNGSLTISF